MSGPGPSHCILHASISDGIGGGGSTPARDSTKLISLLCLWDGSVFWSAFLGSAKQALFTHKTMAGGKCHAPSLVACCMLHVARVR